MPIFVSRFSPERSLLGNFFTSRTPATEASEEPENGRATVRNTNSAQGLDRAPSQQNRTTTEAARSAPEPTAPERDASSQDIGTDSITLLDQLRLRRSATSLVREDGGSAEPVQDPPSADVAQGNVGPLAELLTALVEEITADDPQEVETTADTPTDLVESVSVENQQANEAAATERLEVLIDALRTGEAADAGAAAFQPPPTPAAPPALETREEQERTLREDLQTIATGLRQDAAIEGQRAAEQTARTAAAATDRNQQTEVRENQREIQSLQTDRRQAQQDAQRADQAIRQLQTRNNRIQSSASQPNAGNALDLLAE